MDPYFIKSLNWFIEAPLLHKTVDKFNFTYRWRPYHHPEPLGEGTPDPRAIIFGLCFS